MSLEQALAANTAALEANTAALKSSGGAAKASTAAAAAEKPKAEAKVAKGEFTKAEATALMNQVKEKFGMPVAVELRNKYAKVEKMAELSDQSAIDALANACKEKLAEEAGDGTDSDGL